MSEIPADIFPCSTCKTPTHIDLLDAKDDGTGDYTILECRECYGPGWVPGPSYQQLEPTPDGGVK